MALNLDDPSDERKFWQSLTQAIAWCSSHASLNEPKNSLRLFSGDIPYLSGPESQVHHIVLRRSNQISREGQRNLPFVTDLQGGRLLYYMPDSTDASGASKHESRGFFDAHDCPPFDTWISYVVEGYLVAWIPPVFLELVEKGIEACPTSCIGWLDRIDNPFTQSLRRLNLLS